jgi:hypothetical protein
MHGETNIIITLCSNIAHSLKKYHNYAPFYGDLIRCDFRFVNQRNLHAAFYLCNLTFPTSKKFCETFQNLLLTFKKGNLTYNFNIFLMFNMCEIVWLQTSEVVAETQEFDRRSHGYNS